MREPTNQWLRNGFNDKSVRIHDVTYLKTNLTTPFPLLLCTMYRSENQKQGVPKALNLI